MRQHDDKTSYSQADTSGGGSVLFESLYNPTRLMRHFEQNKPKGAVGEYLRRV